MSDNYSNDEIFDVIGRSEKIRNEFKPYFTEEEMNIIKRRSTDNVVKNLSAINDDLDLALAICNGGLVYRDDKAIYNLGMTQALLEVKIEAAYGIHSWFIRRDEEKDVSLYEYFSNVYFETMFGEKGYRQLFTGDSEGFMNDFRKYGATDDEILNFDRAINNSLFKGEYNREDFEMASKLYKKVSEGRKRFEQFSQEETLETKKKTL